MEQRPGNRDREHDTHEGPGLEGSAVRDLEPAPGDDDSRETAPELVAERQHVGRRAADHGIEHDVQEPLEVLELIRRDLGRDVRIDRLRWQELHDSRSRGLNLAAHVERRDLEQEPFTEPVAVLERGRAHRIGHRVRTEACVPPLGEPLEPVDLGLLHPVRLLDRLVGEHLRHGGVDPALGQRCRDLRLLERRVRQIAVLYRLTSNDVP